MKQITKRLQPGQDVREEIEKLVQQEDIKTGVVVSLVGSLDKASLRHAGRKDIDLLPIEDFEKVDIRVGKIVYVQDFPEARKPAYKLAIDFGTEIGIKKSSVQIVQNYTKEELVGMQVIGVVNFPAKQIGPFISEVLTLGVPDENGEVVLLAPTKEISLGGKLF